MDKRDSSRKTAPKIDVVIESTRSIIAMSKCFDVQLRGFVKKVILS